MTDYKTAALNWGVDFDLKVYTDEAQTQGYRASGEAIFICREDSTGQWYVWKWFDTPGEWGGWGELKAMFLHD